jgi:anaphase-promoting complex subunit 1
MVPTTTELDIPLSVQNAAVIGLGFLYMGTEDGHISRVLLEEIGRPPGPEMEDSSDRESYCLSAGLALGMVCLGKGEKVLTGEGRRTCGQSHAKTVADSLYHYIYGGTKRPLTGVQKEKYKTPSFQIKEGEKINVDITAPGATLALGLMFFNTNHK